MDIYRFLVSSALDVKLPDVVRQNCYSALHTLKDLTQNHILIASAREFVERIGKRGPTLIEARVAFASGLLPYLKQAQLRDLYGSYLAEMKKIGASWGNYNSHGELLRNLEEIGGLDYCPDDCIDQFVEWLVLCYIGEQGGRTSWGNIHNVYYSNVGAPISLRILTNTSRQVSSKIARLEKKSKKVKILIQDEHVARRFHAILDLVED